MYRSSTRLVLALGLLVPAAVAAGFSSAPASGVSGGAPAAPGTYPYVAHLAIGAGRACTGTLVAPQWLLTARSCFGASVAAGAPPQPTTAVVGRADLAGAGGQELRVAELLPRADRDVVLARLALRTSGVPVVSVATTGPAAGDELRIAGYGRTSAEWRPGRLHTAPFTVDAVGATTLDVQGADPDHTSTCRGDAGGPALRETPTGVELLAVNSASWQHGCLGETGTRRGSVEARVDDLAAWVGRETRGHGAGFAQAHRSTTGIGGYDLADNRDQIVAFDYESTGKLDHLLLYRPGYGAAWIVKRGPGATFTTVSSGFDGIGGYDLKVNADRVVPYDYEGTGKLDHLLAYRPGTGTVHIVRRGPGNTLVRVWAGSGIGGFSLADARDQVVAFDYTGSGRSDHLLLYRPGTGVAQVMKRSGASFTRVLTSTTGLATFDLKVDRDRVVPFDFDGTGRLDDLLVYRPGNGIAYVVRKGAGTTLETVFASHAGIGGFDLTDTRDQVTAFDYEHTGRRNHLVLYRPGAGTTAVVTKGAGATFGRVHSGTGLGGFTLSVARDRLVAFDHDGAGSPLHLVAYRPGGGAVSIVGRVRLP